MTSAHLNLTKVEGVRDLGALCEAEVLLGHELPLQLEELLTGERRPSSPRLVGRGLTVARSVLVFVLSTLWSGTA